jgi:putative pyruvate formate lyase activating enzyme
MKLSVETLRARAAEAQRMLASCHLCGHHCGVNRAAGQRGRCRCGSEVRVASAQCHPGEEPALGPQSGTLFFSRCNLSCVFCQNWQISQEGQGDDLSREELAERMLRLQNAGAANINLVTPTPWVPQILEALVLAVEQGLTLPVVYNTGGYDTPETLALMEDVADIYLPDMKYTWPSASERYSGAKDYPEVNRAAVKEMYRQVGDLVFNERRQARSGLLIRLLVLPNGLAGTENSLRWIAEQLSTATWLSIMAQYGPLHRAMEFPELARPVKPEEYHQIINLADALGFENFYTQSPRSMESLRPDFDREDPFAVP